MVHRLLELEVVGSAELDRLVVLRVGRRGCLLGLLLLLLLLRLGLVPVVREVLVEVGFADPSAGDYSLREDSRYRGAGTGEADPGVDMRALLAALSD